jgi:hypothetical protein
MYSIRCFLNIFFGQCLVLSVKVTQTMHIKSMDITALQCFPLKNLTPWRDSNPYRLCLTRMRWPLRHAPRAFNLSIVRPTVGPTGFFSTWSMYNAKSFFVVWPNCSFVCSMLRFGDSNLWPLLGILTLTTWPWRQEGAAVSAHRRPHRSRFEFRPIFFPPKVSPFSRQKKSFLCSRPGVDVMITIFYDFCQFSATKFGVFLTNQCCDQIFAKPSSSLSTKRQHCSPNFSAKTFF